MAELEWRDFAPAVFDEARRRERPVLIVLTKHWCPHSKALLEQSFASPEVLRACSDEWLTVKVDAERRPDVNERYGTGAWPSIAYVTPDGELLAQDRFLDGAELADRLRRVARYFRENRDRIRAGIESLWAQRENREELRAQRAGRLNRQIVEDVVAAIYEKFDHRYGGWGEGAKFPLPEAIDFALVMVGKRDEEHMREVVTLTLDRMMEGAIHDHVDGGFFRYSKTPDWRTPEFEKLLDANAMRLRNYLEAWQLLGKPEYRAVAQGIVRWMREFMLDRDTGAFFGNQAADPEYYALGATGRKSRRPPRVDRTIYTNANATTVSALLKASVVLDDPGLRTQAMTTLRFLLDHLYDAHDGVFHYWDGSYHLPGMLSDQAYLIRALIDASQHSGDADLLLPAERIAEQAIARQKAQGGGFWDILHDQRQHGSMRRRNRSILENSVMAEALLRLSLLSRRPEFHDEAVATLEAFVGDYKEYGYYVAGYGRAVDLIFYQPIAVTIVGDRDSAEADALRRAALAQYVPSRVVQMLDPAHDPILLGRSGFAVEAQPVAHIALGFEERAVARSPAELTQRMMEIERGRR
ncbi:MAG: thioredoxin domain-containing protein [Planctomycetes bacterium]|nr:thioredoxin domain-containing protein [Planctomycetota bacterium]